MSSTLSLHHGHPFEALGEAFSAIAARVAAWTQPHIPSPAEAAAYVRELASQMQDQQPDLAADLRAAADRHELEAGIY